MYNNDILVSFINCNKYTTLMHGINNRGNCEGGGGTWNSLK